MHQPTIAQELWTPFRILRRILKSYWGNICFIKGGLDVSEDFNTAMRVGMLFRINFNIGQSLSTLAKTSQSSMHVLGIPKRFNCALKSFVLSWGLSIHGNIIFWRIGIWQFDFVNLGIFESWNPGILESWDVELLKFVIFELLKLWNFGQYLIPIIYNWIIH